MAKFVCPTCDREISNGRGSVIDKAMNHMDNRHDREVPRDWVRGNIDAHGD